MNASLFRRPWRPKLPSSHLIRFRHPSLSLLIRLNSSLTPKNDVPPPASKPSMFSGLSTPEENKPMFEKLALLTPAIIPEDPQSVIRIGDSAAKLLDNSALVMERRLEMLNVFLGFEQCNRYIIMDQKGEHVGYIAEEQGHVGTQIKRQFLHTHRSFKAHILDKEGKEILFFERPIRVINGRIKVLNTENENRIIGEVSQIWAPLRRKYELSVLREDTFHQFAAIDEPMLSWDFTMADLYGNLIGSINRNFRGFGREIFTDTGQYVLRMDAASPETTNISNSGSVRRFPTREVEQVPLTLAELKEAVQSNRLKLTSQQRMDLARGRPVMDLVERTSAKGLTLDQRAVMLATAVSIDFDYFSHTSGSGMGGMWPVWMYPGPSPDPGVAEPGSSEPATPGLPTDGSNPGMYPESGSLGGENDGGDDNDGGGGGGGGGGNTEKESEWGQESPPSEDNPFLPDEPPSSDPWGGNEGGGGGGDGGGWSWTDIFDE